MDLSTKEKFWIEAVWDALPRVASTILSTEVRFGAPKLSLGIEQDAQTNFMATLSTEASNGVDLFLGFDEQSGIAFSGLMIMMQEEVIMDRLRRRAMDEDDLDAMTECSNQLTSALNEAIHANLESEVHLVMKGAGFELPEKILRYGNHRVIVARSQLTIGKLHSGEFRLLVPEMLFTGRSPDSSK